MWCSMDVALMSSNWFALTSVAKTCLNVVERKKSSLVVSTIETLQKLNKRRTPFSLLSTTRSLCGRYFGRRDPMTMKQEATNDFRFDRHLTIFVGLLCCDIVNNADTAQVSQTGRCLLRKCSLTFLAPRLSNRIVVI